MADHAIDANNRGASATMANSNAADDPFPNHRKADNNTYAEDQQPRRESLSTEGASSPTRAAEVPTARHDRRMSKEWGT